MNWKGRQPCDFHLKFSSGRDGVDCRRRRSQAQGQMRFRGMDRNNDGVITRRMARQRSGVPQSGLERRRRAFRRRGSPGRAASDRAGIRTGIRTASSISRTRPSPSGSAATTATATAAWRLANGPADAALFRRLDTNRDGYLTMAEYTNNGGYASDSQGGPRIHFRESRSKSRRLDYAERMEHGRRAFNQLDVNRDNRISRSSSRAARVTTIRRTTSGSRPSIAIATGGLPGSNRA